MKQSQFIDFFSDLFGVERKTVFVVARAIREAGFLTSGARGVNAPDMTMTDATNMTISLLSGEPPSRVVAALSQYRSHIPCEPIEYEKEALLALINPQRGETAAEFLEALFFSMANPKELFAPHLVEEIEALPEITIQIADHTRMLSICVTTVVKSRRIDFFDQDAFVEDVLREIFDKQNSNADGVSSKKALTGMRTVRRIGTDEIQAIAMAITEDGTEK